MFKNVLNIFDNDSIQVCRLCLAEEDDLIYIFNPEGYQGFHLWETIQELLQMEVSKKDGLPWTICEGCIGKVKEFKNFKTTCIKSKISFLAMMANRYQMASILATNTPTWSFQEPTNAFLKRCSSGTSGKDSNEVEVVVKVETPVVFEDEDPLREVTAVRKEEGNGGKITFKDEVDENESISDEENFGQEIHWKEGSACTGVSNDAAFADPFDMIDVKEDAGAGESWSETVTYNENDLQENDTFEVGASNVVCLPIEVGELCGDKEEDDSSESFAGEEAQGVENLAEDESRLTSVASVMCVPPSVGNVIDGCSMTEGSPKMCEEIVHDLIDDRKKNITKKFERSTSLLGLPGEHSLKTMRTFIAENGESSKSGDYITSDFKLSDVMPVKQSHWDLHKKQLEGCTELICDHCGVKYKDKNKLVVHVRGHISMSRPSTSVTPENSSQKCFESRTTGIQSSKRFKCEICGKVYKWKYDLCKHVLLHSDSHPFKCKICGKGYSGKNELKRHLVIHSDFRPFKCDICGRGFNRNHNLVAHSFIHSGLRPFKCDTCGRGFTQKGSLVTHSVIHSGLRPFKCDICGKGFSQKSGLTLHSVIHSGLRPFKCDSCGKDFNRKSHLVTHSVVHSGLKPFKCETCGKEFKLRADFRRHSILHI